ncbi:tuftelin 1a [Danio rerio]|uniref:Tuftelin 1a n=1 Tax=Danio rerio TaxID=7955 RepID=A0JML6_DANRE|nr:tuftelin 1a [Danio rerio]AAI25924.1 Zgc:153955 [Danio rerio]AAI64704.1 Zgc:153955 protein [Danio rerio]|eukprot:NP_001073470.1 tuftelin [Danio rerio]
MNRMGSMCTFDEIRMDDRLNGHRTLRLTLHEQNQQQQQPVTDKPVGRAFALIQPTYERKPLKSDLIKPSDDQGEVIKVYLEDRKEAQARHQQSLKMLSEEVSQIQEVRYCLKSLREQMAAKSHRAEHKLVLSGARKVNGTHSALTQSLNGLERQDSMDEQEKEKMREASKRLYGQLQEAEKKHQEEREKLLMEARQYKQQLSEQSEHLKRIQQSKQQQDQQIDDLRRLMSGMEQESSGLREQLMSREAEILQLRELRDEGHVGTQRLEELEKDNAILKEKIHHLDDMLKSQQRKMRQMIEQLQNSRMVIQERDRAIRELEEKVAMLEAENKQMRDQMDYYLGSQRSNSFLPSDSNAQIVYSKPLRPSSQSNKSLPFIKVIEIKS